MSAPDSSPWLLIHEAATHCRCSVKTLRRAVARGEIQHARIGGGGRLIFTRAWVDAWVERFAQQPTVTNFRRSA